MNFRELKQNSKNSLKKNYIVTVLIAITGLIFLSLYSTTSSTIENGIESFSNLFEYGVFLPNTGYELLKDYEENKTIETNDLIEINETEEQKTLAEKYRVTDGLFKPLLDFLDNEWQFLYDNIAKIARNIIPGNIVISTSIISILVTFLYQIFLANPLKVGYSRFFLENSKYHKTKYSRIFYAFSRRNYLKSFKTLGLMTIYKDLWNLTIIGGLIKKYSYRLVPYIVAENPKIKPNSAITLSRRLMNGYKWEAFLLDFSFVGWEILNLLTFGILGVFFLNPYSEGANAEFYKKVLLLNKKRRPSLLNLSRLNDFELYTSEEKDYYPGAELLPKTFAFQKYTPLSLGLLFFVFSGIGWCLEVALFLTKTHTFINRGVLFGPWLPIYGSGCVLILLVFVHGKLKKFLNEPFVLFLLVIILCGIIEYATSFVLELSTGLKYWDYAGHFLNINGRICLENLIQFGFGGLLCVYWLAPKLNKFFEKCNKKHLSIIFLILFILFTFDAINSYKNPRVGYGITAPINPETTLTTQIISGDEK